MKRVTKLKQCNVGGRHDIIPLDTPQFAAIFSAKLLPLQNIFRRQA